MWQAGKGGQRPNLSSYLKGWQGAERVSLFRFLLELDIDYRRQAGESLAEELKARASVHDGLPRIVSIFNRICQAVAFAHAQQIVHRDMKPANVMVGGFGEVQVMD